MKLAFSLLALLALAAGSALAQSLAITNPGFESNVLSNPQPGEFDNFIVAAGQGSTLVAVPGWTFTAMQTSSFTSYGGVSDLAVGNHFSEGSLDNNIAWFFIGEGKQLGSISAQQTLAATVQLNTRYTLSLRVAQSARAEGNPTLDNPNFPTLGDGVATGDVFARLRAGSVATAMPGFLSGSSSVSIPADNAWVNWTLVWQTGASESLAGQPLVLELFSRANTLASTVPIEVFFDEVALTAVAIPEPSAFALLFASALLLPRPKR